MHKVAIAVGGTGGHVFPALALAETLLSHGYAPLFLGGGLRANTHFDNAYPCIDIWADNEVGGSLNKVKAILQLMKSSYTAYGHLQEKGPVALVGFGSYHTAPILLAAKWCKIPIWLHEANVIPGRVNRWMAPFVDAVGVHFAEAMSYLKGNVFESKLPLRRQMRSPFFNKQEACQQLALDGDLPTLLVFGGSQGAKKINELMVEALSFLPPIQVIHLTGVTANLKEVRTHYASRGIPAYVASFSKNMAVIWAAADVVVSRAGGASIAEQMAVGIPGLWIPYPFATDQHQLHNGRAAAKRGLGIVMEEKWLTGERLATGIRDLFAEAPVYRETYAQWVKKHQPVAFEEACVAWIKNIIL